MVQVPVVRGGDFTANALLYKAPSNNLINYLQDNMAHVLDKARNYSERFTNTMRNMFDSFNSDATIQKGKLLLNQYGHHISEDVIYYVPYDSLSSANLRMQQFIMTQPDLNKLYERNMCYGYADTFIDPEPGVYGEDRMDYQRVMDGVLQFDSEGIGYTNTYSFREFETPMSATDTFSVLDTWHEVMRALENGKDPSDPLYEDL